MNWNSITLQQFQDIYRLSINTDLDDIEKLSRTVAIIHNKTEAQIDDMSMIEFNKLAKECSFLTTEKIPGKPVNSFRVGCNKYVINYKPTTLKHRQYVEILSFAEKPVENMHYIMASLVNPNKWGIDRPNKVEDHAKIAEDMLHAPIIPIYHSCIFFCKLYSDLIKHIRDYLTREMMEKGATMEQSEKLITDSINAMDGFIALNA